MDISAATQRRSPRVRDHTHINRLLADKTPEAIIDWAILNAAQPIVSTNFRPMSIALIHLVTRVKADIPVLWVDSGYNTGATYHFADQVTRQFNLNLHIYTPRVTAARRAALHGGIPKIGTREHDHFTREVKLEPFERALNDWRPDFWITGIRHDQTDYRRTLDVISDGPHGTTRIAPLYRWTEVDVEGYIYANGLPDYDDYYDPTKGTENRECGLQTLA